MPFLPSPTGTAIKMGSVYKAYTNITPVGGTAVRLNATLGPLRIAAGGGPIGAGVITRLSASFAGQFTTYAYPG